MKKLLLIPIVLVIAIPSWLFGQEGWIKEFPGPGEEQIESLIKTSDGRYIFSLGTSQGLGSGLEAGSYLFEIDLGGNLLWTKKYSEDVFLSARIYETSDNGFLVVARKVDITTGLKQPFLLMLDENGNEEWAYFYLMGDPDFSNNVSQIEITSDGGFLIAGGSLFNDAILRKLDVDFNPIWDYISSGVLHWEDIEETASGNILLNGSNGNDNIIKLDANGNDLWEVVVPTNPAVDNYNIHSLSDGNIMLFSLGAAPPAFQIQIKMDADGNIIWTKDLTPIGFEGLLYKPVEVSDGFVFPGLTTNTFLGDQAAALLKTDMEGELVWQKQINVDFNFVIELCRNLILTDDMGFMGASLVDFSNRGAYLFKTDSLGNIYVNKIVGQIAIDEQANCLIDSGEQRLDNWFVSAEKNNQYYYSTTDEMGNYLISLDTGDYVVSIHPPNALWTPCQDDIDISVTSNATVVQDFSIESVTECPLLVVSATNPFARPCFQNRYYVQYCNEGTALAEDAYINISTDTSLTYVSSSISLTSQKCESVYIRPWRYRCRVLW